MESESSLAGTGKESGWSIVNFLFKWGKKSPYFAVGKGLNTGPVSKPRDFQLWQMCCSMNKNNSKKSECNHCQKASTEI